MKMKNIFTFTILLGALELHASIANKMENWFQAQNYANLTQAQVIAGQSARYGTLGGISTRNLVSEPFHFIDVQTPKFSAGCGGIDFYSGGFSAINADEFMKNLRAIGQNAQSLAFMLAIQVVSPQLSGLMQEIQSWANKINSMNLSSCEAATAVVGGAMELFGEKEGNCTLTRMQSFGEDYRKANSACTTGGRIKETENSKHNQASFIKGNLAWYVLMQIPYFKNDLEFAQLVMNLTGTMIIEDAGNSEAGPLSLKIIGPAISGEVKDERFHQIYQSLLKGATATGGSAGRSLKLYQCLDLNADPKSCQKISASPQEIAINWPGLQEKIDQHIGSILAKIKRDEELTPLEKGIVSSTSIPLYLLLSVSAAYFPNPIYASGVISSYTEMIAQDILLSALNSILGLVLESANNLPSGISASHRVVSFRENLTEVASAISSLQQENKTQLSQYLEIQQRISLYEKALLGRLSSNFLTNAKWGGN